MYMEIKLTRAQTEIARWALDVLPDYWQEQVDAGEADCLPELPVLRGTTLYVPDDEHDMIDDLLYRFEEQYPEVADGAAATDAAARGAERAALNLGEKIRTHRERFEIGDPICGVVDYTARIDQAQRALRHHAGQRHGGQTSIRVYDRVKSALVFETTVTE